MQYIGVIKRVIPFFLTFAAGLFIASFFVNLTTPSFDGLRKNRSHKWNKCKQIRAEQEELRRENLRLTLEIEALREERTRGLKLARGKGTSSATGVGSGIGSGTAFTSDLDRMVPPPPPLTPVKEIKMKTVTVK